MSTITKRTRATTPYDVVVAVNGTEHSAGTALTRALVQGFESRKLNCLVVLNNSGRVADHLVEHGDVIDLSETPDAAVVLDREIESLTSRGLLKSKTPAFVNSFENPDVHRVLSKHCLVKPFCAEVDRAAHMIGSSKEKVRLYAERLISLADITLGNAECSSHDGNDQKYLRSGSGSRSGTGKHAHNRGRSSKKTVRATQIPDPPLPPTELRFLVAGSDNVPGFLEGGRDTAHSIVVALLRNGVELTSLEDILDFGCGCGRVLRHMRKLLRGRFHGSDYNSAYLEWLTQNIPDGSFSVNNLHPPSQFESNSFDFVYLISVFTHLTEAQQVAWMEDFARIIRPGGYLLVTTHGSFPWYLEQLTEHERSLYDAGHLIVHKPDDAGKNDCYTVQSEQHVRRVLCQDFELLDFEEFGAKGTGVQDLYLLRSTKQQLSWKCRLGRSLKNWLR